MINENIIKREQYKIYLNYFDKCGQPIVNKKMTLSQFQKEITEITNEILEENQATDKVLQNCRRIQSYNNNYKENISKINAYKQDYAMGYSNAKRFICNQAKEENSVNEEMTHTSTLNENDVKTDFHKTKMANLYSHNPLDGVVVSLGF